jgi:hypothetical protein
MIRLGIVLVFAAAGAASAQTDNLIWQPPTLDFPDTLPRATISKEMIARLRVAKLEITLEQTPLIEVQKKLGGTIGRRGDAGEALQWLCFHGANSKGRWALWLENSEMGGGSVNGFALQRIARNATVDSRCLTQDVKLDLPVGLGIGLTETQVRRILGKPTAVYHHTLIYNYEHEETIRNEPFTASNTVAASFRGRVVWAIQVWKSTSN